MKKIALIMDGWKRYLTFAWPAGILNRIKQTDEDINLYIFNSSGGWSGDKDYDAGEYNIYNLPDLTQFDGIIVDLNNISDEKIAGRVIERVRKSGVPAISIGNKIDGFYYAGIDNRKVMRELIEHLYEAHGCRNFWFVMGAEDNYEDRCRTEALWEYLEEKGIICGKDVFYHESFEYECGVHGFEKLYSKQKKLPDAVICGSDNIAVGVCETAQNAGFEIPKDFFVTGFDDFDKAFYYKPKLTTVRHIREDVGELCVDIFLKLWKGEKLPQCHYTKTECIFRESCGCESWEKEDAYYQKNQIMYGIETRRFEDQVLALEYELMRCNTVQEMMYCIPQCIPSLKCDAMYLVLDPHMDAFKNQTEVYYNARLLENEGFLTEGYPECMKVVFAYENGVVREDADMEIQGIFPMFDADRGGVDFLFLPMHFKDRSVGYLIIRNAVYLMEKQYLFSVVKTLINAMENLHKKEKLAYMNEVLAKISLKDSMTGMYNRLGYQKNAERMLMEAKEQKKKLLVMYIDMDRLKFVNDHYGHEYGDFSIVTIAKTIMKCSRADAVPARMGGDEFVLIQIAETDMECAKIAEQIEAELKRVSEQMLLPFMLGASVGGIVKTPEMQDSLEELLKEAETLMYEEKTRKKVMRTE